MATIANILLALWNLYDTHTSLIQPSLVRYMYVAVIIDKECPWEIKFNLQWYFIS